MKRLEEIAPSIVIVKHCCIKLWNGFETILQLLGGFYWYVSVRDGQVTKLVWDSFLLIYSVNTALELMIKEFSGYLLLNTVQTN